LVSRADRKRDSSLKPVASPWTAGPRLGRKTVYDLLTDLDQRVVPVGRLDLGTSGLLLFTNDTQLANWLTDPHSAVPRVYLVTVEGRLDDAAADKLIAGVVSDGDELAAAAVTIRKTSNRESHVTLTLTEGKNREIRRLFDAIGHPVTQLRRVQFGGLELDTLAPGTWRRVAPRELRAAFPGYSARRKNPPSARRR
jgi:23S rRNA pseudouridine2605 synthase